jgi:ubiquinone biosynthesis protein UbiJ
VIELRLGLSLGAMRELLHGQTIAFDIEEEDLRLVLRCDEEALAEFKDQLHTALMNMLPTPNSVQ